MTARVGGVSEGGAMSRHVTARVGGMAGEVQKQDGRHHGALSRGWS